MEESWCVTSYICTMPDSFRDKYLDLDLDIEEEIESVDGLPIHIDSNNRVTIKIKDLSHYLVHEHPIISFVNFQARREKINGRIRYTVVFENDEDEKVFIGMGKTLYAAYRDIIETYDDRDTDEEE